jgi:hypothetical protein
VWGFVNESTWQSHGDSAAPEGPMDERSRRGVARQAAVAEAKADAMRQWVRMAVSHSTMEHQEPEIVESAVRQGMAETLERGRLVHETWDDAGNCHVVVRFAGAREDFWRALEPLTLWYRRTATNR